MADPNLIADISGPTAAAGIVVLAARAVVQEVVRVIHSRNGGTATDKTLVALESIDRKTSDNGARLDGIARGVASLQSDNMIAKAVAEVVRATREEHRERNR